MKKRRAEEKQKIEEENRVTVSTRREIARKEIAHVFREGRNRFSTHDPYGLILTDP